jgi:hypothetical protein
MTRDSDAAGAGAATGRPWGGPAALGLVVVLAAALMAAALIGPRPATTQSDQRQPAQMDTRYVSDMPFTAVANGLGPVERNATNGGEDPEDGSPIEVDGLVIEHGLGVYPFSQVRLHRPSECTRFLAIAAVTPEPDDDGGVAIFKILGDGRPLYRSGRVSPSDGGQMIELDVGDIDRLDLLVAGPDTGGARPAAVWADARFLCQR